MTKRQCNTYLTWLLFSDGEGPWLEFWQGGGLVLEMGCENCPSVGASWCGILPGSGEPAIWEEGRRQPVCWCSQACMRDDWAACMACLALQRTSTHSWQGVMWHCVHAGNLVLQIQLQSSLDEYEPRSPGNETMFLSKVFEPCAAHSTQNVGENGKYPGEKIAVNPWEESAGTAPAYLCVWS